MSELMSKLNAPTIKVAPPKDKRNMSAEGPNFSSRPPKGGAQTFSSVLLWLIVIALGAGGGYSIYFLYQENLKTQEALSGYSQQIQSANQVALENREKINEVSQKAKESIEGQRLAFSAEVKSIMTEIQKLERTLQDIRKEIQELKKVKETPTVTSASIAEAETAPAPLPPADPTPQ
jgi:uncharacterized protein HemX